jgi:CopG family nickel-responsive transcriptional regulator
MPVTRFGISIEQELLKALDEYVKENRFSNRSQAIRHLINRNIIEHKWQCNNQVAGSITLFYDPEKRDLLNQINHVLESFHEEILSTQRFYLEKNKCLEIVAVKGIAKRLTALSDALVTLKGINHCKLTMSRAK